MKKVVFAAVFMMFGLNVNAAVVKDGVNAPQDLQSAVKPRGIKR